MAGLRAAEGPALAPEAIEASSMHLPAPRRSGGVFRGFRAHRVHGAFVFHVFHEKQQVHTAKVWKAISIQLLRHMLPDRTLQQPPAGDPVHPPLGEAVRQDE